MKQNGVHPEAGLSAILRQMSVPTEEQHLIERMLKSDAAAQQAVVMLASENFSEQRHQIVFEAAKNILASGGQLTLPSLADELRASGKLEQVGGVPGIGRLFEGEFNPASTSGLICLIMERATRRRFYLLLAQMQERILKTRSASQEIDSLRDILESQDFAGNDQLLDGVAPPSGPGLLNQALDLLERRGLARERRNASIIFLALVSRTLERPVNIFIAGPPSGGKSHSAKKVLELFPSRAFRRVTTMSPKAILYMKGSLRNVVLFIAEADGIGKDPVLLSVIRELCWEGKVSAETVDKVDGRLSGASLQKSGPTGLIMTGVRTTDYELQTRMFNIEVEDTPAQSREVLRATARNVTGEAPPINKEELRPWHILATVQGNERPAVVIPFATWLAERVPVASVRVRRDFAQMLGLVAAHAILERSHRKRDANRAVIAELEDYGIVASAVGIYFMGGRKDQITSLERDAVRALERVQGEEGVSLARLGEELGIDSTAAGRRLGGPRKFGYVVNNEGRKGQPGKFAVVKVLSDEGDSVLPSPGEMAEAIGLTGSWIDPITQEHHEYPVHPFGSACIAASPPETPTPGSADSDAGSDAGGQGAQ